MTSLHVEAKEISVYNASNRELIKTISSISSRDLERILDSSRTAQEKWAKTKLRERSRIITAVRKKIITRSEEIIESLVQETGKPKFDAFLEIQTAAEHLRFISKKGPKALKSQKRSISFLKSKKGSVHLRPFGVVGIISPWNYPLVLSTTPVTHALIAGNSAILKPSELTPLTDVLVREIFIEGGIPEDVFQVAVGDGRVGQGGV